MIILKMLSIFMDFYIIYSQDSFIIDTDELTWK